MTSSYTLSVPSAPRKQVVDRLVAAFTERGFELYLVGGAVRDLLLGKADVDLDFATSALPNDTAQIVEEVGLGRPYRIGEKYGTIGIAAGDTRVEITTFRAGEHYEAGSRKPNVRFGGSIDDDLRRRDFTINAMAQDPHTGHILDPHGGLQDLRAGVVRAVGRPEARFQEDPLRLLRAIRFAARLGFTVAPSTLAAMQSCAPALERISRERVRDELTRMLESGHPVQALCLLRETSLLQYAVPALMELTRMPDHGPRHPLSLWDHVMRVVEGVPPELTMRWAALLHDVAKPATRTHEPDGRPRFFHHETVGAAMARQTLTELRYPGDLVDDVVLLVETHMQLHSYSPEWSDGAVRRLMVRLGPLVYQAIVLARADAAGHNDGDSGASWRKFDHLEERIQQLNQAPPATLTSPLTGNDLMERYGRPPGPWIREIKDVLLDEVMEGRLAPDDREAAFGMADSLVTGR